jgi:ribosomal protein S18 acetylase RimI-like enzyme
MTDVIAISDGKADICREIMSDLSQWFDHPDTIPACAAAVEGFPMLGLCREGAVVGFIALKEHPPSAAEIFVLGVKRRFHREGIGHRLVQEAGSISRERGRRLLTVKTLAPLDPDPPHYAATRRFYDAAGFLKAEIFPTYWHPSHPCQFMVKPL